MASIDDLYPLVHRGMHASLSNEQVYYDYIHTHTYIHILQALAVFLMLATAS